MRGCRGRASFPCDLGVDVLILACAFCFLLALFYGYVSGGDL